MGYLHKHTRAHTHIDHANTPDFPSHWSAAYWSADWKAFDVRTRQLSVFTQRQAYCTFSLARTVTIAYAVLFFLFLFLLRDIITCLLKHARAEHDSTTAMTNILAGKRCLTFSTADLPSSGLFFSLRPPPSSTCNHLSSRPLKAPARLLMGEQTQDVESHKRFR